MMTVVSRWEQDDEIARVEWRFWCQLRAFGIDRFVFVPVREEFAQYQIDQYETMEEALSTVKGNRVFLESTGYNTLYDLPPRDEDVVFILGSSCTSNARHMQVNESFRIAEPRVTDMYPTCAGSIALACWHGQ